MLSDVPECWNEKALKDICVLTMGQSPKSTDVNDKGNGIPFLQGCAEFGAYEPTFKAWIEHPLKVAKEGDILFSVRAPVGKMNYAPTHLCIGRGLCSIRAAGVDSTYLQYSLEFITPVISSQSQGSTFQAVNKKQLEEARLLLPPLAEQKRIAEVLGSVDESIQATQRLIEQAERVKQGLMEELLTGGLGSEAIERGEVPEGWQCLTAKDLAEVKGLQTGPFGSQLKANEHIEVEEQGACRVIMPKNIKNGQIDFESASIITADKANDLAKHALEMGDVLFARRGDLSKVAIYYGAKESICGTGCLRLRPKKELVNTHFLRFLFTNHKAIDWLHANAVGATMLNLNTQIIGRLPVLLPPIKQQEDIASALMAVEDFCFQHEVRLSSFAKLKKGLMDDLLTGKVRTV